jgi:LysM repeat protein
MTVNDVYSLNPGYKHMQVTSSSPGHILIPVEKVDTFKQNMDAQGKTIDVQMPTLAESSHDSDTTSDASAVSSNNNAVTYKVQAGDTLSKVALHNHIKLADLLTWNHLTAKNVLHSGQSLQISAPGSVAVSNTAPSSSQDNTPQRGKRIDEIFYPTTPKTTVVQLDNKNTTATAKNKEDSPTDNKVANTTYRVKTGDTLSTIAKKQHVSVAALQKTNHLKSSHLKVGQVLTIPQTA